MEVENLLDSKKVEYRVSGADCIVSCLNPDHNDTNPSMRIDRVTGIFGCFACGTSGNIFQHFGATPDQLDMRREKLKAKMSKLRNSTVGLEMPKGYRPYEEEWRGFSAETLKRFEAFTHKDYEDMIVFPIRDIRDKICIFLGRIKDKRSPNKTRYMLEPKKASIPLYPAPFEPINGSIVVVEGITDMLRLYDIGITNVICAFGTQTFNTPSKLNLIKVSGVSKLFIMFDGDDAGRDAALELEEGCEEAGLSTEIIKLADGVDPDSLSDNGLEKIKRVIYESN